MPGDDLEDGTDEVGSQADGNSLLAAELITHRESENRTEESAELI